MHALMISRQHHPVHSGTTFSPCQRIPSDYGSNKRKKGTTLSKSKKMGVVQLTTVTAINMMGSGIILLPATLAEIGTALFSHGFLPPSVQLFSLTLSLSAGCTRKR